MATASADTLKLDDEHADIIIRKAIQYKAYSEDFPETTKARIEAATELISFCIDAYNDGVRSDDEDEDNAESGRNVEEIMRLAGVSVDDDGDIAYGKLPRLKDKDFADLEDIEAEDEDEDEDEEDEDEAEDTEAEADEDEDDDEEGEEDEDDDEEDDDDEAPVDISDVIDGYVELTPQSRIKEIKALKLDVGDEDDVNTLNQIIDWEEAQDKPSSRVLSFIEETYGEEEESDEEDEEGEEVDGEPVDEEEDEEEAEEEGDEPWDGYDKAKAVDINTALRESVAEGEATADQIQYVLDYEQNREKPPPRKRIITLCQELLEQLEEGDEADDEEEDEEAAEEAQEEAPVRRGKRKSKTTAAAATTDDELMELVPAGLVHSFVTQKLHEKRLGVAGLAAPGDWEGDMPEIPDDMAGSDHDELSNLLGEFVNAFSTATWYASRSYIESGFYDDIVDYLENVALLESTETNDTKRKAEARTDDGVVAAKALHRAAYSDYVRFRDLANTLKMRHATVSRVGGFMTDESESEDVRSSLKLSNTRGKGVGTGRGTGKGSSRARSRK